MRARCGQFGAVVQKTFDLLHFARVQRLIEPPLSVILLIVDLSRFHPLACELWTGEGILKEPGDVIVTGV